MNKANPSKDDTKLHAEFWDLPVGVNVSSAIQKHKLPATTDEWCRNRCRGAWARMQLDHGLHYRFENVVDSMDFNDKWGPNFQLAGD